VVKVLNQNTEKRHVSAPSLIYETVFTAFPCKR